MKNKNGFTLIELMVTLAIVAILATVSVPSYFSFVKNSRIHGAQTDLVNMSVSMASYYQQKLAYPASTDSTDASKLKLKGWYPTQDKYFKYTIETNNNTYVLKAVGISNQSLNGYTLTLDNTNSRSGYTPKSAALAW